MRLLPFLLASCLLASAAAPLRGQEAEGPADWAELQTLAAAITRGNLGRETSEALDEYLGDFPKSARALALRAELQRRKGRYEEAEADVEAARAAPIADTATRVAVAQSAFDLHFERGAVDACAQDLDGGLQLPAGSAAGDERARVFAPLWSRRVVLLAMTGRRKEAYAEFVPRFKDAVKEVEDAAYVLELGRALLALGDLRRAAEVLVPLEKLWRDVHDVRHVDALLLLGRVYRIGHSGGDALPATKALGAALEIDPDSVPVNVELARTRLFRLDHDQADAAIDVALAANDRSPDAWSVRAEILLLDQRPSDALDAADRALRENPRHGPALAIRIAALGVLGRVEESQKGFAQLLANEPDRGENFCRIGDVLNYLYRFREAIPNYRRAIQVDPNWSASYVGMARCLINTSDQEGALAALKSFRQHDDVPHMLADNTMVALRTLAGFVEVRRGNFTYVMHPVESPVLVPLLEELYGKVWPDLCARYGLAADVPVRVECFPMHNDFSARTVGFTGFGALGVCFGNVFTLLSPRSELRGHFAFDKTAVHELTHVVTLSLSKNKVPRWLTEGISVHEEHVYASNGDREMDLDLFNYFKSGEIIPVLELNRVFGGPKILFGYYQGGLLADFLVEQHGDRILQEMLEHFARDEETATVIPAVLGISCEQLDRDFLEWLDRTRISGMKVQPTYTEAGRRRLLERARASEPGTADAELLAQVAWAYHQADRPVDRDDYLHRALAADPRLPAARFLLAERALTSTRGDASRRAADAKQALEAGFEAGGEEFFAYQRYIELVAEEGGLLQPASPQAADAHAGDAHAEEAPPKLDDAGRALRERLLDLLGKAKRCFPRYVAENNPYILRAKLLRQLGREDDALAELREYCAIHETDAQARQILVDRALERSDWKEARSYLLELRGLDPFQRTLWRDLARCERALGSPAAAIALLEQALVIDPSTEPDYDPAPSGDGVEAKTRAELLLDLAELRLDVGETAAAKRAIEEASGLSPDAERLEALRKRAEEGGA